LGSGFVANAHSGINLHKATKDGATVVSRAECVTQIQNVEAKTQLGTLRWWCRNKGIGGNHGKEEKVEGEEKSN